MKKLLFAIMAVTAMSVSFVSCDKTEDEPKGPEGISGSISSGETLNLQAGVE